MERQHACDLCIPYFPRLRLFISGHRQRIQEVVFSYFAVSIGMPIVRTAVSFDVALVQEGPHPTASNVVADEVGAL